MSSKKWFISLISITMVIVILFGALQFYLDPLLQYGGERGPLTFRKYDELYGNPGIAKNYDYNAVLLGPSTAENTDINELNSLFGCDAIKVTYAGGSAYNHKRIFDICTDSRNRVDKVFWAFDETSVTKDANTSRWPLPEYLYDNNIINDVSYLLNLDVFYFYTLFDIKKTLNHQNDTIMLEGTWGDDESIYCKKNALLSVSYPKRQHENKGEKYFESELLDNLELNILPMIEEHPEIEFNFFMVPYSILYWYLAKSDGTLDARIYNDRIVMGKILDHDNVKVYFFQDEKEVITNLDLYKDYTHYKPSINSWMLEEMKKGSHLLTKETYNQKLDDFYDYLNAFDYDNLFS